MRRGQRTVAIGAVAGFVLHAVAILWGYRTWGFGRGGGITWLDFPASLLYLQMADERQLAASLLAGGLQWALIAALLTWFLGRAVRRQL